MVKFPLILLSVFIFLFSDQRDGTGNPIYDSQNLFNIPALTEGIRKTDIYLFHQEGCASCRSLIPELIQKISATYPHARVTLFDLKEPQNYKLLTHLEDRIGRRGEELPVAVAGDHLLSGIKEIEEHLDRILLDLQFKPPIQYSLEPPQEQTGNRRVSGEVVYFYQNGCIKCSRTDAMLNYLRTKYPELSVRRIDISTPEGKSFNEAIGEILNLPQNQRLLAPAILIGDRYLPPGEVSEDRIEKVLLESDVKIKPPAVTSTDREKAESAILTRFDSIGPIPVFFGGLLDGLNPCAFATLVFLISYLSLAGAGKKEIIKIGLGFTGAVFTAYLLIGLGVISFIHRLPFTPTLSKILYGITAGFALFMGLLSLYDFILWKKGKQEKALLQLPGFLKQITRKAIRSAGFSKYHLPIAALLGFTVSILEFACTGQVYLPTLIFVLGISPSNQKALSYLVLYNLAFILPLVTVFLLFFGGITQYRFASFLKKRGALIKGVTSVFFLFMGGIMLTTIF